MRKLSFLFVIVFALAAAAVNVAAQSVRQSFEEGTRAAVNAEYERALENYRRAILDTENEKTGDDFRARIHFNIGVCLYHLKQNAEAVNEFNRAITLSNRTYQKAFYVLGMAQAKLKNWGKAEAAFREAIRLKKDDAEAWFDLGLVLLEEEDFRAAEKAFQNSLRHKTIAAADAHNNLGVIYVLRGNFASAEREFEAALIESKGASEVARNNLEFCKSYKQNFSGDLSAKLEFGRYISEQ
ncbi:MAG: tetratricopeptide repeat protein [Acidobacteriota bacterium]|nr:tetratricopeptide repeat protein [Acidobacteriota bacterium]